MFDEGQEIQAFELLPEAIKRAKGKQRRGKKLTPSDLAMLALDAPPDVDDDTQAESFTREQSEALNTAAKYLDAQTDQSEAHPNA